MLFLRLFFFLPHTYSISCTAGEGFLIFDCLYLQFSWWPFVCRWPTPRWHLIPGQKKCVVMLYGTVSRSEEITNTVNATVLHSWPVERPRPTESPPAHINTPTQIICGPKPCRSGQNEHKNIGASVTNVLCPLCPFLLVLVNNTCIQTKENTHSPRGKHKSIIFIDCHLLPTVYISCNTQIYCVNHNKRWQKCETWSVVTFLTRWGRSEMAHNFGTMLTSSRYNWGLRLFCFFCQRGAFLFSLQVRLHATCLQTRTFTDALMLHIFVTMAGKTGGSQSASLAF